MGRVFLVESDSEDQLTVVCFHCHTYIALPQNTIYYNSISWPASEGLAFTSSVNLVESRRQGIEADEDLELSIHVHCVKCYAFLGYRKYPTHNSSSEPTLTYILNQKMCMSAVLDDDDDEDDDEEEEQEQEQEEQEEEQEEAEHATNPNR